MCREVSYEKQSTLHHRAAGIGYGERFSVGSKQVEQGKAPSPSSYRVQHDNINHHKSPAFTFGVSREAFDKVYLEGKKGSADPTVPGPGNYAVEDYRSVGSQGSNKYSMRTKGAFQDFFLMDLKKATPGPGSY